MGPSMKSTTSLTQPTRSRACLLAPMIALAVLGACSTRSSTAGSTTAEVDGTPVSVTNDQTAAPVPDGSGCTPGPGQLPDGRWYGHAVAVAPGELQFDLACWFTGDAATAAATEDGSESPPPNGYHVRNDNPSLRVLRPADATPVTWYPSPGDPASETDTDYANWRTENTGTDLGVWITIEGGQVTFIKEQWTP